MQANTILYFDGKIRLDSGQFFEELNGWNLDHCAQVGKFRAEGPSIMGVIQMTSFRLEHKQRGAQYWVAYRRVAGKLHKTYVCHRSELTRELIDAACRRLQEIWQDSDPQ